MEALSASMHLRASARCRPRGSSASGVSWASPSSSWSRMCKEGPSRSFGATDGALPHGCPYIAHPIL